MIRTLTLPVALVAALAFAAPEQAEASPMSGGIGQVAGTSGTAYGGVRIHVGGGVRIPLGHRHRRVRTVRSHHVTGGYWKTVYETRIERVWHAPELVGYDSHGRAVYSEGHYDEVEVQVPVRVWVPARTHTVTRVRHHRARPVGHISIGGSWRIR